MSLLVDTVKATINKYNMIDSGDVVVVGVSGGADSLSLLHILNRIKEDYNLKLYAVHLNHKFRGIEADEDAEFVRHICKEWNIPSFIETFDVPAYIEQTGLSPEEAGREVRYRLFYEISNKVKATKIAVAQNMNDNIETVLMRFMRGSGIEGLKGIEHVRDNIIRPLLDIERDSIEEYCRENNLQPRLDKTNLQPIYIRNKIRLELIPYIKQNFNPNIMKSILRLSNIMKEENDYLEKQVKEIYQKIAIEDNYSVKYSISELKTVHSAVQRRLIRMGIEKLIRTLNGFEYKNIEGVLALIEKPTGAAVILPQKVKAYISYDKLIITKNVDKLNKKCRYKLKYNCNIIAAEADIIVNIYEKPIGELKSIPKSSNIACIDSSSVMHELILRTREQGDIFSPIGMKGKKKLKEYFIDEKIPREQRDDVLLIADGEEIVWVVGRRLSNNYRITSNTKKVLIIEIVEKNDTNNQ